jgi:quercetin 2,3-dioxygenase
LTKPLIVVITTIVETRIEMTKTRKAKERGHFDHGWLQTWHTFSFASYYDPAHMGYRSLRVINDDTIAAGEGFGTHGHRDMEILTYVLSGALQHRDSMGNGSVVRPGNVQRMSAGTGVTHSEFNASATDPLHLLQIWILPEKNNLAPGYEEKLVPESEKLGRLRLLASRDGRDGSVVIHQDVRIYASILREGDRLAHALEPGRGAWVQVATGSVEVCGTSLSAGDGLAVADEKEVVIRGTGSAELILFDLA